MHIDWDLLANYLAGTCTDERRAQFEQWLAEAPEHRAVLRGAQCMIADADYEVSVNRAEALFNSLRRAMLAAERRGPRPPALRIIEGRERPVTVLPLSARKRSRMPLAVAAAVLLAVGSAAVWVALPRTEAWREMDGSAREIVANRGQRLTFQLSDGSTVVLAPESRLRIPRNYGVERRSVSLTGEAAFTVTHDVARPFAVHTAHGVATDLGTRFVVREYDTDASVEVVVAEGAVELRARNGDSTQKAVLTRGQQGRVASSSNVTVQSGVDLDYFMAWTEGRLVFHDTPLRDVADRLTRWYDIDVQVTPDAIAHRHLTATVRGESAGDVLRMVAASLDLDLQVSASGRTYTLSAR